MAIKIFDLDGTVVDSSHRHVAKADGSFCLDGWRKNCTPKLIMRDKLLPLAEYWKALAAFSGVHIIVCTARVIQSADLAFLEKHGLRFNRMLARMGENDNRPDGELKHWHLSSLGIDFHKVDNVFYEDNLSVHEAVKPLGINVVHPESVK